MTEEERKKLAHAIEFQSIDDDSQGSIAARVIQRDARQAAAAMVMRFDFDKCEPLRRTEADYISLEQWEGLTESIKNHDFEKQIGGPESNAKRSMHLGAKVAQAVILDVMQHFQRGLQLSPTTRPDVDALMSMLELEAFSDFSVNFTAATGRGPTRLETWIARSVVRSTVAEVIALVEGVDRATVPMQEAR